MKVVHIARYLSLAKERKVHLMARQPGMHIGVITPGHVTGAAGSADLASGSSLAWRKQVPFFLRSDPHRGMYGSLTFGLMGFDPDIIHLEEEPDSLSALQVVLARRLFAPRAILLLHTWQNIDRPKSRPVWWVTRTALRAADAMLCANEEGLAVLRDLGYRGPAGVLTPQGVDMEVFRPRPAEPAGPFTALFLGRLVREKGVDDLLRAAAAVGPAVRVWVVGDGPYRQPLVELAGALGIAEQVTFSPAVPQESVPQILCQAHVLVLPSRGTVVWKEQFGRVLIEAMACRLPVIGSDSGAIPEVIGDAGMVFPEGNAEALAERLRRLIASPELRADYAERGYQRACSHYATEVVAEKTVEWYRRFLADVPPAGAAGP